MGFIRKEALTKAAAGAAGITCALAIGMLFPNDTVKSAEGSGLSKLKANSRTAAVSVGAEQPQADVKEEIKLDFIEYRKANISEYKMATVTSVPVADPEAEKKAAEEEKKKKEEEEKQKEEEEKKKQQQDSFNVVVPEDGTEAYDIMTAPLYLTDTRSVANEYYTVNDLISGGIVTMNAHEMLCRIVYNEIGALWDEEAIKAQIVAAYTHLRYSELTGRTPTIALKPGYPDIIERCVSEVEGQCVFYNGQIINAVYAASTAGYTADSGYIFGMDYPYLVPAVSEYDDMDPNWGVEQHISPDTIKEAFEKKYGMVLSDNYADWFVINEIHSGKYVASLTIDNSAVFTGSDMRTLLGLRSSAFEIAYENGEFIFTTYGFGHGVGMSQWGAKLYADAGWTYDQILRHYYVNTTVDLSNASSSAIERGIAAQQPAPQEDKEDSSEAPEQSDSSEANDDQQKAE